MKLTREEQVLLDGGKGLGRQRAMKYLVDIGEAFDAEKMVPITAAHVLFLEGQLVGPVAEAFFNWPETFLEGVDFFAVPTTLNAKCIDLSRPRDMGISVEVVECADKTMPRAMERYEKRGAIQTYSCTPHTIIQIHFGEHVAVTEGGVVKFTNSVIGARTHYETIGSALAAAVVGRVPLFGLHLREN